VVPEFRKRGGPRKIFTPLCGQPLAQRILTLAEAVRVLSWMNIQPFGRFEPSRGKRSC